MHAIRLLLAHGTLAALMLLGCGRGSARKYTPADVSTLNTLTACARRAKSVHSETGEPIPTTLSDFVEWLEKHARDLFRSHAQFDAKEREVRDGWGHPIILLIGEGKVIAFGSAGADAKWQDGGGDDLIVKMGDEDGGRPVGR